MGKFDAGRWIIVLGIYFFSLFLVTTAVINSQSYLGYDASDLNVKDTGFLTSATDPDGRGLNYRNVTFTDTSSANMNSIFDSIGFLTGFGADTVSYGIPSGWVWVFSIILFWIPMFMLLWAIYMALPFLH